MSVTSTTDTTDTTEPRRRGRGVGQSLRTAVAQPLRWSGAGVRGLGRTLRVLRGWWGLTLGVLVAAAVLLGPAGGARWIAHEATLARHAASVTATSAYHAVYVAVAWPAANGALWLNALHPTPRHGSTAPTTSGATQRGSHVAAHPPHGVSLPTIPSVSWRAWWQHGADWRYNLLQRRSGRGVRQLIPLELGGAGSIVLLFAGLIAVGRRRRGLAARPSVTFGGSRFQTFDELKRRRARPGDLVLGTARKGLRRVTVSVPKALLVEGVGICAPNGMGKSNAFFKAHLLEADPDVDYLVTDPKGEHWDHTAGALARTHDVYRLDMMTPANSVTWAPLALERTPAQAEDWARAWLKNSKPKDSAPAVAYFEQAVQMLIAAAIPHVHAVARAAGRPAGTLDELTTLLLKPNVDQIIAAMKAGPADAAMGPALESFLALIAEHRDLRTSIPSGLAPRLTALNDPDIRAVVGGGGLLDLDRLGRRDRRPVAVYIVTPVGGDRTLRPLVGSIFTTVFRVLMDRARTLPRKELDREVRLLLDEFGTMGAVPDAPDRFNTFRQVRVSRILSWQLRSQLVEDYEEAGAEAIVESCNALAWLGGTRGRDADDASKALGNRTVLARSEGDTAPRTLLGRRPDRGNQSLSETGVPLLYPDDLAASSRRRVVVSVREARPMDLRTRPFWAARALKRLSRLPAPVAFAEAPRETTAPTPPPASTLGPLPTPQATPVPPAITAAPAPAPRAAAATTRISPTTPAEPATAQPTPAPTATTRISPPAPPAPVARRAGAPTPPPPPQRSANAPQKAGRPLKWTGLP